MDRTLRTSLTWWAVITALMLAFAPQNGLPLTGGNVVLLVAVSTVGLLVSLVAMRLGDQRERG